MIEVKVFGKTELMANAARSLDGLDGIRHVVLTPAARTGCAVIRADARHDAVDPLLALLTSVGVEPAAVVLTRVEEIGLGLTRDSDAGLVWADIVGLAGSNARLVWRYLTLMVIAGVIAGYGVLDSSPILVVGAMAVSPDLLPITAAGVAVASRDARLLDRALVTLGAGMAAAGLAAALSTALQDALGVLPGDFAIDNTLLHGLDTVGWATITVAFFAASPACSRSRRARAPASGGDLGHHDSRAGIPRDRGGAGRAAGGDRRARRARHEHHAARRGRVHDARGAACAAAPPGQGGSDAATVIHMTRSTAV